MSALAAAVLLAISLRPSPNAVGYSLQAGRCFEQVAPGATELRSTLAVGASARLSAIFRYSRICGGHGKPTPCPAAPLRVTAGGGVRVASVLGTDIQIKAQTAGAGEVALRARKKQFPPLDQVKDQVTRYVVQKSQSELILKLREAAKVERTEPEKPADAAATPGPETKTPANPSAPATSSK